MKVPATFRLKIGHKIVDIYMAQHGRTDDLDNKNSNTLLVLLDDSVVGGWVRNRSLYLYESDAEAN